jgi:hypothetical protein
VGVVMATFCCVCFDNCQHFGFVPRRDGKGSEMPIPLVTAEYDSFPLGFPVLCKRVIVHRNLEN